MDKYPIMDGEQAAGELTVRTEGLYTVFEVSAPLRDGLWCVWAVGRDSALRIGIPEPMDGCLRLCRRFSRQLTAPTGPLLRGELRPLAEEREQWAQLDLSALPPPLRQTVRGLRGLLACRRDGLWLVAVPRNDGAPFPLEPMFCFARSRRVRGRTCWVFAFDETGCPRLP